MSTSNAAVKAYHNDNHRSKPIKGRVDWKKPELQLLKKYWPLYDNKAELAREVLQRPYTSVINKAAALKLDKSVSKAAKKTRRKFKLVSPVQPVVPAQPVRPTQKKKTYLQIDVSDKSLPEILDMVHCIEEKGFKAEAS